MSLEISGVDHHGLRRKAAGYTIEQLAKALVMVGLHGRDRRNLEELRALQHRTRDQVALFERPGALIARREPEPFGVHTPDEGGAWPFEREHHLVVAARHARARADANPGEFEIVGFADAVDTLLWWETTAMPARLLADINIGLRDGSYLHPRAVPVAALALKEAA